MKYLIKDLYVECFYGKNYTPDRDNFIVGYYNKSRTKIIDVRTGQILEGESFLPISRLRSSRKDHEGNNMALGYMTGLRANEANISQYILAKKIDKLLSGDVIDADQILKIKLIMNAQIKKTYNKQAKKSEQIKRRNEELKKYKISDDQREF